MKYILFLIFMALSLEAHAQGSIAIVGDSLSVGLEAGIKTINPAIPVQGYGVRSSGLARTAPVDWQSRIRNIVQKKPVGVLVLIGANDMNNQPDKNYLLSVVNFLNPLRDAEIPFFVISIPFTTNENKNINIKTLNDYMEKIVPRMNGVFLKIPDLPKADKAPDGINFTGNGYKHFATLVLNAAKCSRNVDCHLQ